MVLDFAAAYVDETKLRAVTDGYVVHIHFAIHGTEDECLQPYMVYIFRYEAQWKVAIDHHYNPEE